MPSYLSNWDWAYFARQNPALAVSLVMVGALLLAWLVYQLLFAWLLRQRKNTPAQLNLIPLLRRYTRFPGLLVLFGFAMVAAVPLVPLPGGWLGTVNHALAIFQIFCVALLLIRISGALREYFYERYAEITGGSVRARKAITQYRIFERIAVAAIVFFAIIAALTTFEGVRTFGVSLLASAGVISVILGFAAQKSIATVLAGIQIAIAQPIRLDDAVVVEGEWGYVEEITLTYVVIRCWDERRLVVPIQYFIDKPFFNWTRNASDIMGTAFLHVDYLLPMDELRQAFLQVIAKSTFWDKRRAIMQVTETTDRVAIVRFTVSAQNSEILFDLRCEVREKLIAWIGENYPNALPQGRVFSLNPQHEEEKQAAFQSNTGHKRA